MEWGFRTVMAEGAASGLIAELAGILRDGRPIQLRNLALLLVARDTGLRSASQVDLQIEDRVVDQETGEKAAAGSAIKLA